MRPFDPHDVHAIVEAISSGELGLTAQATKTVIRVPIPPLSQDRRVELARAAKALAETARVSMRNVRRDVLKEAAALGLPLDELRAVEQEIETLVRKWIKSVDEAAEAKAVEVLGEKDQWNQWKPQGGSKRKPKEWTKKDGPPDGWIGGEAC